MDYVEQQQEEGGKVTEHIIEIPFEKVHRNSNGFITRLVEKLFPDYEEMSVEKIINRQIYKVRIITQAEKVTPCD